MSTSHALKWNFDAGAANNISWNATWLILKFDARYAKTSGKENNVFPKTISFAACHFLRHSLSPCQYTSS